MINHTISIERAKKAIMDRHFDAASKHLRKTASPDPGRAEAFKLFGVIMEGRGDRGEAQKNYRAALSSILPMNLPSETSRGRQREG